MARTIRLEQQSRYKDTNLLENEEKQVFYDLWVRPRELVDIKSIQLKSVRHRVKADQIGRLDILAHEYFRDTKLWWVIAAVNDLIDPIEEMYAGQVLIIPSIDVVRQYTNRGSVG